ncbi:hypothetical protein [Streptomyces sp. NPDC000880]
MAPDAVPTSDGATDTDVWPRAVALDDATRAATGNPVSIWRLRTELRIGPRRARQIRDQLLARHHAPPPRSGELPRSAVRSTSTPVPIGSGARDPSTPAR